MSAALTGELQYGEHARWECLRAAGISQDKLLASGVGPVALEATIRYLRELRGGDEVDVSCAFLRGEGKVFHIQPIGLSAGRQDKTWYGGAESPLEGIHDQASDPP